MRTTRGDMSSMVSRSLCILAMPWLVTGCGGGGGPGQDTVQGQVIGTGAIAGALVCADFNANVHCDASEAQARTDASGNYEFRIAKDAAPALVAEVIAGVARDAGDAGPTTASYRMTSPSPRYSSVITPYTTLVQLSGIADPALAEDDVRNNLGLPPRFDIGLTTAAAAGSLTSAVAKSVIVALKATGMTLDLAAPGAYAAVIAAFPATLNDLPVLRITTKGGAPIESKEIYVDATYVLTNPVLPDQAVTLNGKIRGRGHSTWGQPKNPYKVQFSNDASYAQVTDVLGMKKNRNWALLADFYDKSLLRNKLAYSLGNSAVFADGIKWTPSGQHVEVFLNDDYVGVYLLNEDIRIDPARLNIRKMSSSAAAGEVDGGYIVEIDMRLDCVASLQHITPLILPICIDTPDETSITPAQLAYVNAFLDGVEADLFDRRSLSKVNPVSFADWYLLQELFRNNDAAFLASDWMWKDTDAAAIASDRLLNMGPIWDFDIAAGNITYNDNWKPEGCWVSHSYGIPPNWVARMLDNPDFLNLTLARWKQKRPALGTYVNASIDTFARRIEVAQQRNFERWPYLGIPLALGDYYLFPTHAEQVAFLKRFLNERMVWLDQAFATPESFNALCK
jgi:hypothetical protein